MQKEYSLEPWPWKPELCPADQDFMEFLTISHDPYGFVFHMGTGSHHKVGKYCTEKLMPCIGLTASEIEFTSAIPYIGPYYQVMLCDLYKLNPELLPDIDYLTLFHIGEMVNRFGDIQNSVIDDLIRYKLHKDGLVFFYLGSEDSNFKSSASDRVMEYVQYNKLIRPITHFKSLQLFRKS